MKISHQWRDPQPLFCDCNFQYISKIIQFIYLWKHIELIRLYIVCARSVNICHKKWQHITFYSQRILPRVLSCNIKWGSILCGTYHPSEESNQAPPRTLEIICASFVSLSYNIPHISLSLSLISTLGTTTTTDVCRHVTSNGNNMSGVVVLFMTARDEQEFDQFPKEEQPKWGRLLGQSGVVSVVRWMTDCGGCYLVIISHLGGWCTITSIH